MRRGYGIVNSVDETSNAEIVYNIMNQRCNKIVNCLFHVYFDDTSCEAIIPWPYRCLFDHDTYLTPAHVQA